MPPKTRKKGGPDPFVVDDASEEDVEETVNLGDAAGIKRAIDNAVIQALEGADLKIDYTLVDTRIALGAVACVVACVAQFWPTAHPWNRWICASCVAIYAGFNVLLSLLAYYAEKNEIARTQASSEGPALIVSTQLPKWSDQYTLIVGIKGQLASDAQGSGLEKRVTKSIGKYVHADGVVDKDKVATDVKALLQLVLAKKKQ